MSNKISSRIEVKVDGQVILNKSGWTFSPGGMSRETVTGDQGVHGFTETPQAAHVEGDLSHKEDLDLVEAGKIEDATILVTTNTGQQYVMRNAWRMEPAELNTSEGSVATRFESLTCERM